MKGIYLCHAHCLGLCCHFNVQARENEILELKAIREPLKISKLEQAYLADNRQDRHNLASPASGALAASQNNDMLALEICSEAWQIHLAGQIKRMEEEHESLKAKISEATADRQELETRVIAPAQAFTSIASWGLNMCLCLCTFLQLCSKDFEGLHIERGDMNVQAYG